MEKDKAKHVHVEPDAHQKAKVKAAKEGKTMKEYVTELIVKDNKSG